MDDGGDDIDNEAEILMWIKDFLTNELGKLGVNVPMLLMNNIRSLGSDELVLQVIYYDFLVIFSHFLSKIYLMPPEKNYFNCKVQIS